MPAANLGVLSGPYSVDQGVDFSGQGVIPALAPGRVTDVGKVSIIEGGTYPYVIYRLGAGPYKGQYVYLMESFTPTVHVGEHVKAGQAIGVRRSGKNPGPDVGIEIGFNKQAKGINPVAPLYPNPHSPKAAGETMARYISNLNGSSTVTAKPPSSGGGVLGGLESAATDLYKANPVNVETTLLGGAVGGASHIPVVGGIFGEIQSANDAFKFLFSIRGLQTIGGGIIFLMGLYLLARQVGLAANAPGIITAAVAPELAVSERIASAAGPKIKPSVAAASEARTRRTGTRPSRSSSSGGRRTVRNVYYLDDRPQSRAISDPATNDIGF
jgi:hypothetical protein